MQSVVMTSKSFKKSGLKLVKSAKLKEKVWAISKKVTTGIAKNGADKHFKKFTNSGSTTLR